MSGYSAELYGILAATLFWLAALTFLTGLLMLLVPGWLLRMSEKVNLWIDTSVWFRKLDEQQHFERLFYRHHVLMGLLIVAGSLYSLWFIWRLQGGELAALLPVMANPVLQEIVQVSLACFLLAGNLFALLVGLVVLLRPSLLKGLEAWANRWVASDQALGRLDRQVDVAERMVPGHPRLFGLLVVVGSLYIMSNTLIAVFPG